MARIFLKQTTKIVSMVSLGVSVTEYSVGKNEFNQA